MADYHKLLEEQLANYIGEEEMPEAFKTFLESVNFAYKEFEKDKALMEKTNCEYSESIEKMKAQIASQEKMATIGQLSAGVAHEINNPLGFVKSNINTLESYINKVKKFLELSNDAEKELEEHYEDIYMEIFKDAIEFKKKNKLKLVFEDMDDIVLDSEEGIGRIENIVKSLLGFARGAASSKLGDCDLNSNINSTLTIANNEIKYYAQVEKQLEEIPIIKAINGEINQVILNLLVNAAYAIKTKGIQGIIKIHTYCENNYVKCKISDNGIGISKENLNNIFNPFFTTKPIGIGTGLGLSISYDIIVKKHCGSIEVDSILGEGTTFIISLPIDMKKKSL
ncbi:sensor histidine kinase [Clostridium saccharoperbutylacetonicum]|uniref:sensor histidine kinase n=1 Tax=Clostridium saccharoperbutylacetonicum TaxID=36745 RepID=UPI0039E87895